MNKYELIGIVSFGKGKSKQDCVFSGNKKDGSGEYRIMSFTLYNKVCGYLDCKTFDWDIIDNIMEGDRIELVDYIPQKTSWTNTTTGIKNYKVELRVNMINFLGRETDTQSKVSGWVDKRQETKPTITKEEVDKMFESEEIKDIENTLENLGNEEKDTCNIDEVLKGL